MPEIRANTRQERFLQIVKKLDLENPNAEIIAKTKENAGNVSNYLSGKKPPSKNFLKKFSAAFDIPQEMFTPYTLSDRNALIAVPSEKDQQIVELRSKVKYLEEKLSEAMALNKELTSLLTNKMQKS